MRNELAAHPVAEGRVDGDEPLYIERYMFRSVEQSLAGQRSGCLVVQLGGAHVHEGETGRWRASSMPSQALLVPANCPTHWHYAGPVDFAIFYFPIQPSGLTARLCAEASTYAQPRRFSDALVCAASRELVDEVQQGGAADQLFMAKVASVLLEQSLRAIGAPRRGGIHARPVHLTRLLTVLEHVREHLAEDLSGDRLAAIAQVSESHFRRLFTEAMGISPHRYVLEQRLTRSRELLTTTNMSISQIALTCGFSSQSHLSASFRSAHSATPAEYRITTRSVRFD